MKLTMKAARVMADKNQQEMAEMMGVSRVSYNKWENGKGNISKPMFKLFCLLVNMDENDVFMPCELTKSK